MRIKLFAVSIILILVCSLVSPSQKVSASSFEVNYTLTLEKEDYPEITVRVHGYPDQSAEFVFLGQAIGPILSLDSIFQKMEVKDLAGNNLYWQWIDKGISVSNGSVKDFTISYSIDAIHYQWQHTINLLANRKCVLFRFGRISFAAGDVFLTPKSEPERITVDYSLPEGTTLYASLPSENGTFQAVKDLWGNLQLDFSLAYFAGGQALFTLNHTTEWGDEYQYIWLDRDYLSEAWTPWYGNTPWEQAELYMEGTEFCARYFRDKVGPLPNHRVLFTNTIELSSSYPNVASGQDWFHYMQIWPRYSEPAVCHHVFHMYSNNLTKLAFGEDPIGKMFSEGLPTYYEQILPGKLLENSRYKGKLFELYVLDARGIPFGIRGNELHVTINVPALKVYLLDQYIQSVTGGADSLDSFVKAMWDEVKDNPEPQQISQADIQSAFSSVVGSENTGYLDQLTNLNNLDLQEFSDLRAPFSAYANWMIHEYFWDKPILFYMYLDIVAAKGKEWPYYATAPHNVIDYGREALQPVWDYLSTHSGNPITRQELLDAMSASTGGDHAGFFEFWESLGITLDPNEVADLANWDPKARSLEDLVPKAFLSIGNLSTEHLLAEVPQKATIHLDASAPTNQIFIGFKYFEEGLDFTSDKAENVIQGDNVSFIESWVEPYEKFNMTTVLFGITTDDPNNQDFPITLTYPNVNGVSRFGVSVSTPKGDLLGDLYYLGPIQPITFELDSKNNEVILPDTPLESETYLAINGGEAVQYKPGEKIRLSFASGPVEVQLFDKYGFIRGMKNAIPINLPPTANFEIIISDPDNPMILQFTDTSSDPDGQIKEWFWDFGDGKTSSEKNPLYTYNIAGSYSVSLTVTDEGSNKDTHNVNLQIEENQQTTNQNSHPNKGLFILISGGFILFCGLLIILDLTKKMKLEKKQKNEKRDLNNGKQIINPIESEPNQGHHKRVSKLKILLFLEIGGAIVFSIALIMGVSSTPKPNATLPGTVTIITSIPTNNPIFSSTSTSFGNTESTAIRTSEATNPNSAPGDLGNNETTTPNTSSIRPKDGMTMLFVPEGEFNMGSDVTSDEQPIHIVYLDSFWIDKTEVTNAMYAHCVAEGTCIEPYDSSSSTQNNYYGNSTYDNYPVIYVDWFQAKTYCEWAGGGLPTEAQWEKAAIGTDERIYPWGNENPSCDLANKPGCIGDTTAVGSYAAGKSPYGALDMAGNVWEWVSDWYDAYPSGKVSNPQGPSSGEYRIMRGGTWRDGSWFDVKDDFRPAFRGGIEPLSNDNFIGFRCALPVQ